MSSWARPGVKCVFMGKGFVPPGYTHPKNTTKLKVGKEYTIREVLISPISGELGVYLDGIMNGYHPVLMREYGYYLSMFRPLITPEQDIALFHTLCPGLPVVPPAVVPKRVKTPSYSD